MKKRIRLSKLEIDAVLTVAGASNAPAVFEDVSDDKEAERLLEAFESGMSKLRRMLRNREGQTMPDHCLCPDFELRGQIYEIWTDSCDPSNRRLIDPRKREVVDTDHAFTPPLSNDELLAIYDYGKGY